MEKNTTVYTSMAACVFSVILASLIVLKVCSILGSISSSSSSSPNEWVMHALGKMILKIKTTPKP